MIIGSRDVAPAIPYHRRHLQSVGARGVGYILVIAGDNMLPPR